MAPIWIVLVRLPLAAVVGCLKNVLTRDALPIPDGAERPRQQLAGPRRMRVEVCRKDEDFLALREEWSGLYRSSSASPFLSWEWLYPAWSDVTPSGELRIFTARDDNGRLVGLLPLVEERLLGSVRSWSFLGDSVIGSDYLDVLAPRGIERPVAQLLWKEACKPDDQCDLLVLRDMAASSPSLGLLAQATQDQHLWMQESQRHLCPRIVISGTFAEYLKKVGRAENLRRRRRWLESRPGFAIDVATTPEAVSTALPDFFRLHDLRWQTEGGSQGVTGPTIETFHRHAAAMLAEQGMVRLYTLSVDGRAIASLYLLARDGYRAFYQSGYDPAFAQRSPGLVLLGRAIEDAFAENASEFDFLRGVEKYKLEWANDERRTVEARVALSLVGAGMATVRLASRAGKWLARQWLPESLIRHVQTARARGKAWDSVRTCRAGCGEL
ncbi:MAG: GNAT family N-acetyltransferase [Pseudomonadota bacterium]